MMLFARVETVEANGATAGQVHRPGMAQSRMVVVHIRESLSASENKDCPSTFDMSSNAAGIAFRVRSSPQHLSNLISSVLV